MEHCATLDCPGWRVDLGNWGYAQVHTTYLWHMQQPIYWPEQSAANPHRYQTAWESHQLKFSEGTPTAMGWRTH